MTPYPLRLTPHVLQLTQRAFNRKSPPVIELIDREIDMATFAPLPLLHIDNKTVSSYRSQFSSLEYRSPRRYLIPVRPSQPSPKEPPVIGSHRTGEHPAAMHREVILPQRLAWCPGQRYNIPPMRPTTRHPNNRERIAQIPHGSRSR